MGTNFYWVNRSNKITLPTGVEVEICADGPDWHIGKRSAAGRYCWDCKLTLCMGGEGKVHTGSVFAEKCPRCGKGPDYEDEGNPAMVELGFSKPRDARPSGVRGCSSFCWAQDPDLVREACKRNQDIEIIEDEYGHRLTGVAFLIMLESNCPIEFTDSIGQAFS